MLIPKEGRSITRLEKRLQDIEAKIAVLESARTMTVGDVEPKSVWPVTVYGPGSVRAFTMNEPARAKPRFFLGGLMTESGECEPVWDRGDT